MRNPYRFFVTFIIREDIEIVHFGSSLQISTVFGDFTAYFLHELRIQHLQTYI